MRCYVGAVARSVFFFVIINSLSVSAGTWNDVRSMATPRYGHAAVRLQDGRVLVVGGHTGSSHVSSVEIYDPFQDAWSTAAPMSAGRYLPTATLLADGRVLVAGGSESGGALATAEIYSPTLGRWSPAATMHSPRSFHTATLLTNGNVLVTGGYTRGFLYDNYTSTAEVYDPARDTWTSVGSMSAARVGHTASLLPTGSVVISGGANYAQYESTADLYDPVRNIMMPIAAMAARRYNHAADVLPDGRVMVVGGMNFFDGAMASTEIYDPVRNSWVSGTRLSKGRRALTLSRMANDGLLATGGYEAGSVPGITSEIYSSATGRWEIEDTLNIPHAFHTATVLVNGGVLVAGGFNSNGTVTARAEVWSSATPVQLLLPAVSGTFGGTVELAATLLNGTTPVVNRTIKFSLLGSAVGVAVTGIDGVAKLVISIATISAGRYPNGVQADFLGDTSFETVSGTSELTVGQARPPLSWATPPPIVYGTALSSLQLNASSPIHGTFLYDPAAGTVPNAGLSQILVARFTSTDTNYSSAEVNVHIDVLKAAATLTLGGLSQVADGAPKQVSLSSNPPAVTGVVVTYNGSIGAPSIPGSYDVLAVLNNSNYEAASVRGTLVIQAPAEVGNPAPSTFTVGNTTVNVDLPSISTAGTTTVTPISSADAGSTPGGFQIQNTDLAFDVTTTAGFSSQNSKIVLCFTLTSVPSLAAFQPPYPLRILHREPVIVNGSTNYQLIDRTVLKGNNAPNALTKTICAETTTLSPFVTATALDFAPPQLIAMTLTSNPMAVGAATTLSATVTDAQTGNAAISLAEYSIDGGMTWAQFAVDLFSSSTLPVNATISPGPGVYNVCVRASDAAQNSAQACGLILAVYDPSGGFVTGGGWLNSPPGAYRPDQTVSGKANFGFVAKYHNGASTPDGQTEFQFKAGNFNFKSSDYEWLVVVIAGAKAQFKGSGTVNGAGNYGFMLTATDGQLPGGGGVDKLRLKVWDRATDAIIYDNVYGAPDDLDSTNPQAIGGGSIVIHR